MSSVHLRGVREGLPVHLDHHPNHSLQWGLATGNIEYPPRIYFDLDMAYFGEIVIAKYNLFAS